MNFVVNSGVISKICSRVLVLFQENAMQQNLISPTLLSEKAVRIPFNVLISILYV